jgi:tetratricopeptide (TPR) repeat protein
MGWNIAANYCLTNKTHLDEGLRWAERAIDVNQGGQANFTTLSTLADLQEANNQVAEGKKTRTRALHDATAGPIDLHLYARQLLAQKKATEAMEVFQLNYKLHPKAWPVELGLARGYAALGQKKEALEHAKLALPTAPDPANKKNIQDIIEKLQQGKDI